MQIKLKNSKGASLIEIVCAVAILGIITVAFAGTFSFGSSSIFSTGTRNKAMNTASSKLELLYAKNPVTMTESEIESFIGGTKVAWDSNQLYTYTPGTEIKFSYTNAAPISGSDGYIFKIAVFYDDGNEFVTLTSFIKGGG